MQKAVELATSILLVIMAFLFIKLSQFIIILQRTRYSASNLILLLNTLASLSEQPSLTGAADLIDLI